MCDVWCVMCDVWCVMCDVWCVMCGVWCDAGGHLLSYVMWGNTGMSCSNNVNICIEIWESWWSCIEICIHYKLGYSAFYLYKLHTCSSVNRNDLYITWNLRKDIANCIMLCMASWDFRLFQNCLRSLTWYSPEYIRIPMNFFNSSIVKGVK